MIWWAINIQSFGDHYLYIELAVEPVALMVF